MRKQTIWGLALAAVAVGSFFAGWFAREHRLLDAQRYVLRSPLKLSGSAGNSDGVLPAGTVLYPYRNLPEISTFMVFVNTKRLDTLRPEIGGESFLVAPVEAY